MNLDKDRIYLSIHTNDNPLIDDSWPQYGAPLQGMNIIARWEACDRDPLAQLLEMGFKLGETTFMANVVIATTPENAAKIALAGLVRFAISNAERLRLLAVDAL